MPENLLRIVRYLVLFVVAAFFTFAGVGHFTNADFFIAIVPPYLQSVDRELVYISGVFEILGGIGVLVPMTRKFSGYGLLALLVAVYPANIHMAMNPEQFPDMTANALLVRLPFQLLFAAMVWWSSIAAGASSGDEA
jgi:uncharacterized membrane protein